MHHIGLSIIKMQQAVEVVLQSYRDFYLFLVSLFVGDCDYIFFFLFSVVGLRQHLYWHTK